MSGSSGLVSFGGYESSPGGKVVGVLQDWFPWQEDMAVMLLPALFFHAAHLAKQIIENILVKRDYLRCITMGSLWDILFIRVYASTSPASFVPFFHAQPRASSCQLLAIFLPRNTVTRHRAPRLLFLAAFQGIAGGGAPEVEEGEELAGVVLFTSITTVLERVDSLVYFVQHVISCRVAEIIVYGAVRDLETTSLVNISLKFLFRCSNVEKSSEL